MMEKSYLDKRQEDICYNLDVINEKIAEAAIKSGRVPENVRLMAVTKTVDPMFINMALGHGVTLIGENRVQELLRKKDELHLDGVEKHLIGHLQTNKAGQIVGVADMIQSVDSVKIAKEIAKQSIKRGVSTDVLLEINIGGEESKTGFDKSEFLESVYQISEIEGINVKGIMSVPPICENNTILCKFFENIYNIYVDIKGKKIDNINMQILSMGMSGDYEQAILCGSTLVRIGSAIFGPRIY